VKTGSLLVLSSIQKFMALFFPDDSPSLKDRYESALVPMRMGDFQPMLAVAALSLGDAWLTLANAYCADGLTNEIQATDAFRQAAHSRIWLNDLSSIAQNQYDRRRLLGIGIEPDHQALAQEWERQYFAGHGREFELAWIYACGAEHLRNKEVAWKWLVIGEARWGEQDELELPSGSVQEMRTALKQSLPKRLRQRAIDKAKILAHREFVEGK
jgi:hypothetical protein